MMTAAQLLSFGSLGVSLDSEELNPFANREALREAQLLGSRFDAVEGNVGLLFELRAALSRFGSNTGVLVGRGAAEFRWVADPRSTRWTAWNVVGWSMREEGRSLVANASLFPNATLVVRAERFEFYICDVVGIGEAPPDYGGAADAVQVSLAHWDSPVVVRGAASLEVQ